ncbi:hypothetical protein KY326_04520, partial [Candidatus Woesearchaeota archaeon]|nr:hypothetical protein [Candidatus Woesearchaeota archaeon]
MANDLVAGKAYTERIGEYLGDKFVNIIDYLSPNRTNIPVTREREEAEFDRSCIGKPRFLRPFYRIADSVGVSSPTKRIENLLADAEKSIESLNRRIAYRTEELEGLRKRYNTHKIDLVSKRDKAKSAIKKGKLLLRNNTDVNRNDEILVFANTYAEFVELEKSIE